MFEELEAVTLMLSSRRCDFAFRLNVSPWTANADWARRAERPPVSPRSGSCAVDCVSWVAVFLSNKKGGVDCHFKDIAETLTEHPHGHSGLRGTGRGRAAGVTCQLPPVVIAQSGDP